MVASPMIFSEKLRKEKPGFPSLVSRFECMCVCACIYTYIYIYTFICVYIYVYICTYIIIFIYITLEPSRLKIPFTPL